MECELRELCFTASWTLFAGADRVQRAPRGVWQVKKQGGKTMIQCQVNGVQRSFDGDPGMPLL
jgi:hypothetical protein